MPQNFPDFARIDSMPKSFFYFDEKKIYFEQGMSVAAALLCAGVTDFRQTQVLHKPRGAFCMMGACFDCLLVIDGMVNQQGCMRLAKQGIKVKRQTSDVLSEIN